MSASSCPFSQWGGWQRSSVQTPSEQSASPRHQSPAAHGSHWEPPQSTSVSAPFFEPSEHGSVTQMLSRQMPSAQSSLVSQEAPTSQGSQSPPQSMPVSMPP